MNDLTLFKFNPDTALRVEYTESGPWFVASDVCKALQISDTSQAVGRLDDDERGTCNVRTPSGDQQMLVINEFGLYSLAMSSRKPEAKAFRRWVLHEVLPTIRKTGGYIHDYDLFLKHDVYKDLKARALEETTQNQLAILKHHVAKTLVDEFPDQRDQKVADRILARVRQLWTQFYPNSDGVLTYLPPSMRKSRPSQFITQGEPEAEVRERWRMMYKHIPNPPETIEQYVARCCDRPNDKAVIKRDPKP